jgi:RimJ/RimL family protein N-acetyltransferase
MSGRRPQNRTEQTGRDEPGDHHLRPLTRTEPIILETIDAVTASIAFAIDPTHRHQRLATNMIQALTHHPDLAAVELFEAGVEPENHLASTNRASSMSP